MTYLNSLAAALSRSLDVAVSATRAAVRMDVAPTARSHGALPLYALKQPNDLAHFATGADADIGGLSSCRLVLDPADGGRGRFFGTLSTQIPRGGRIERSGYAGFRNKNRPTLFGSQTWDASLYPFLLLRVRNRMPVPSSPSLATAAARLAAAMPQSSAVGATPGPNDVRDTRALHALGIGFREAEPPGPKFFVNVQTDGPVTSDLFQHRLWLHPTNEWQDIVIPFSDFALTNTGQVASSQIQMMREKIRTVGISAVLSSPARPTATQAGAQRVSPLSKRQVVDEDDDWGPDGDFLAPEELGKRGARRGGSYNFDLGIEGVWAVGEDMLREPPQEASD